MATAASGFSGSARSWWTSWWTSWHSSGRTRAVGKTRWIWVRRPRRRMSTGRRRVAPSDSGERLEKPVRRTRIAGWPGRPGWIECRWCRCRRGELSGAVAVARRRVALPIIGARESYVRVCVGSGRDAQRRVGGRQACRHWGCFNGVRTRLRRGPFRVWLCLGTSTLGVTPVSRTVDWLRSS